MSGTLYDQWIRKCRLTVSSATQALDLSEFRIKFQVLQSDVETPNNAAIRVYNLSDDTIQSIRKSYTTVILEAGYETGNFGVIFYGTLKQFRIGRENLTDSYIDLLAADGDTNYNDTFINQTIANKNNTPRQRLDAAAQASGLPPVYGEIPLGGVLPRGKVLFGLPRVVMRQTTASILYTWSIQNGKIQFIPLQGYLPTEVVQINSFTGMVGYPEQTDQGIKAQTLLNPKLVIGGRIQINNADINQTLNAVGNDVVPLAFNNPLAGPQRLARTSDDGLYRIFVAEHAGDTRGREWYTNIVGITIDPSNNKVIAKQ